MSAAELPFHQVLTLYTDHHGWLYSWLRRKLGCPHRAADIAQATFLRILAARHAVREVQQPRAWLTTTATRLIVDEVRRQRMENAYLAELALGQGLEGSPGPEEQLNVLQAVERLSGVLAAVSANARRAFMRHYIDGETLAAVAQELHVSTRMVQKYLAQVLLKCQI